MSKRVFNDYHPKIIGLDWAPGNLILVASRSWGGKNQYVLGNCIVAGTKEEIPVAYFLPDGDSLRVAKALVRMQVGPQAFDSGQIMTEKLKELPLYLDDTPDMTIAYIINRLFHLAETKGIGMAVIDGMQDINTSQLDGGTRERELNSVLRLLKAMAEALGIVIIVKSSLSDYGCHQQEQPSARDILDVTEAKTICDQIILLHRVSIMSDYYKMILPLGHPFFKDDGREMVLNLVLDKDMGYFKKAESLYKEEDSQGLETPMYMWYQYSECDDSWHYEFLDEDGMGWQISLNHLNDSPSNEYHILFLSWSGEDFELDPVQFDTLEITKHYALDKAREHFPAVEIPEID